MPVCPSCGHENPAGAAFCNACGGALAAQPPAAEQRKTVTVLFCDVTGSTALGERLDPESLRRVLARYFEVARDAVARHGGVVEKFIGDAVMAIFGVPRVHEDDALRAVRAALDLRDALAPLNAELDRDYGTTLALRIGVNTGEVVTGTEERLATGDAVNVAARLEQAAQPDEILIGAATLDLVRDAVTVEAVAPVDAKGKSEPLAAYRLLAVDREAPARSRRIDVAMVGRGRQLQLLRDAFDTVVGERACHLFTVLGAAGVGKSRLVSEFLRGLGDTTVLAGRCLSYGEGITYWPAVEIVKQAGGPQALADEAGGATLEALVGEGEGSAATPGEIAWAFRKLLEAKAGERPVVCLVDDIQWGEDTFLELVEHVADLSRDAPILLVCMARPELLDRRPTWAGGKLNATSVLLEPLSEPETDELIARLLQGSALDGGLQARIRRAAGGNPLFVEEMLALVDQAGDGADVAVPPTIQALLTARLDQLDASERHVLEHASVEGEVFHRGGVAALGAEEPQLDTRLTALVRKDLVRPERAQLAGEDGYRFRHLLIRDAAYSALPKATRAALHERFAAWLEERGPDLVEVDEILGYHLEQAFRYRDELGPVGEEERGLARRAGELLARAGRRAADRGDRHAATNLLRRASGLLGGTDELGLATLVDFGRSLIEIFEFEESRIVLEQARADAAALGRRNLEMRARSELVWVALLTESDLRVDEGEAFGREAVRTLEAAGDDEGAARAWFVVVAAIWARGRWDDILEPAGRSIEHARRAGRRSLELDGFRFLLAATIFGATPADEGVAVGRRILAEVSDSPELQGWALRTMGTLLALSGRVDEGRKLLEQARTIFHELDESQAIISLAFSTGGLERDVGDLPAAEREYRTALDLTLEIGDRGRIPNLAGFVADTLLEQGRADEADRYVRIAREAVQEGDVGGQAAWRMSNARLLAHRGELDEALRLSGESIALMETTHDLLNLPDMLVSRAEILRLAGQEAEAAAALRAALAAAERKGAVVKARLARERLAALV